MNNLYKQGHVIAQRFEILNRLGQGGTGITYAALDLQTNQTVALKMLSLRRMKNWKTLELFEREAKILANLNHPAIPQYLDYFEAETEGEKAFYIVQELAPGKSIFDLVQQGWQASLEEVEEIAIQILEILVYLQELTPAAIHRDIKPQNIILQEDGKVFLVDFGAVQDTYHNTVTGGSTVVGTYGYMAPEQFRAKAVLSTDLYGLGATLLFLLTGQNPADLPQQQLKIKFQSLIQLPVEFAAWLERMIEPDSSVRFTSAREALAVLLGNVAISPRIAVYEKPHNCNIKLIKEADKLFIHIPRTLLNSQKSFFFGILECIIILLIMLVYFYVIFDWATFSNSLLSYLGIILFSLLFPFNPLFLMILEFFIFNKNILLGNLFRISLEITPLQQIKVKRYLLVSNFHYTDFNKIGILQASLQKRKLPFCKYKDSFCCLKVGHYYINFGLFLSEEEKVWLVKEIRAFLEATN